MQSHSIPTAISISTIHKKPICSNSSATMARDSSASTARPSRTKPGPSIANCLAASSTAIPGANCDAPLLVTDPDFPGMKHLPSRFTMLDEIYQIKDFDRKQVRLLMTLDRKQIDLHRQGVHAEGNDFPLMWAREYGKGRVLYNSLGHRHEVWERSDMQSMWLDQIRWILRLPNDAQPAGP